MITGEEDGWRDDMLQKRGWKSKSSCSSSRERLRSYRENINNMRSQDLNICYKEKETKTFMRKSRPGSKQLQMLFIFNFFSNHVLSD